jgi:predicted glycoside hydrolase/deacetylase ChbG (UPF0249 family)
VESLTSLIVNADDFGYSRGVNRGIVEAHEYGIVTSASLMVDGAAAEEAGEYAGRRPELSVGLHVDLGTWRVRAASGYRWRRGDDRLQRVVAGELLRQLRRFRRLIGSNPTHLDSHHHRHREPLVRAVFAEVAGELDVPLRHFDPEVQFRGDFYGQIEDGRPDPDGISPDALVDLLESLSGGVTELCCHPGYPEGLKSWYREERLQEVRTLCDPRVRAAVDRLGIRLISFHELAVRRVSETRPE